MMDVWIEKDTPFETGRPVSPENFKGRKSTIQKIIRYVKSANNGIYVVNKQKWRFYNEAATKRVNLSQYHKCTQNGYISFAHSFYCFVF